MATFDIDSLEADAIKHSKKELDRGCPLTPIIKLRLLCLSRGVGGFGLLGRSFVKMNIDTKEGLSPDTFKEAFMAAGYTEMEDSEIDELYEKFENSKDFFHELRPQVSHSRAQVINTAYSKMDSANEGSIDFATFKKTYNVNKHPEFHRGDVSKGQLFKKILANFEGNSISNDDFLNYYSTLSSEIDKDCYFDLLMRECYRL